MPPSFPYPNTYSTPRRDLWRTSRRPLDPLHLIKQERTSQSDFVIKSLADLRIAAPTGVAGPETIIAAVVGPLLQESAEALGRVGVSDGLGVAHYEPTPTACSSPPVSNTPATGSPTASRSCSCPASIRPCAAFAWERWPACPPTWQHLTAFPEAHGLVPSAGGREVYLKAEGERQSDWVVELQQPVTRPVTPAP